jgi:membrane-associated phospholipid phosphatase
LNSKKINLTIYLTLAIWVILAIVFAFYDLEISKELYNPSNDFAIFIQNYGELPGVFLLIIASIFAGFNNKSFYYKHSSFTIAISTVLTTFLILYSIYVIAFPGTDPLLLFQQKQFYIIGCVTIFFLFYFFLEVKIDFNSSLKIKKFTKISLLTGSIGYGLFVLPLKIFWGRIRFRDLDALYSNFSLWYLPQVVDGNQSFPSGHAAMAFMLLPLVILVWDKRPIIRSLVILLVCMWGILVCLCRIVIGTHYASDVLFGSFFMIITLLIIYKRFTYNNL